MGRRSTPEKAAGIEVIGVSRQHFEGLEMGRLVNVGTSRVQKSEGCVLSHPKEREHDPIA